MAVRALGVVLFDSNAFLEDDKLLLLASGANTETRGLVVLESTSDGLSHLPLKLALAVLHTLAPLSFVDVAVSLGFGAKAVSQAILPVTIVVRAIHHGGLAFAMILVVGVVLALVVVNISLNGRVTRVGVLVLELASALQLSVGEVVVQIGLVGLNRLRLEVGRVHAHLLIPRVVKSRNRSGGGGQSLVRHLPIWTHDRILLRGGSRSHLLLPLMHHLSCRGWLHRHIRIHCCSVWAYSCHI